SGLTVPAQAPGGLALAPLYELSVPLSPAFLPDGRCDLIIEARGALGQSRLLKHLRRGADAGIRLAETLPDYHPRLFILSAGVDKYQSLKSLHYATNDATALAVHLLGQQPTHYEISPAQLYRLTDAPGDQPATRNNLLEGLR